MEKHKIESYYVDMVTPMGKKRFGPYHKKQEAVNKAAGVLLQMPTDFEDESNPDAISGGGTWVQLYHATEWATDEELEDAAAFFNRATSKR